MPRLWDLDVAQLWHWGHEPGDHGAKGASQMRPPADWWLQRTAVSITMRGLEFGNCSKTESLSMFCLLRKAEHMLWFLFWQPLAQLVKGYYCSKVENLRNEVVSEARPKSRNQGPGGQRSTRATTKKKQEWPLFYHVVSIFSGARQILWTNDSTTILGTSGLQKIHRIGECRNAWRSIFDMEQLD